MGRNYFELPPHRDDQKILAFELQLNFMRVLNSIILLFIVSVHSRLLSTLEPIFGGVWNASDLFNSTIKYKAQLSPGATLSQTIIIRSPIRKNLQRANTQINKTSPKNTSKVVNRTTASVLNAPQNNSGAGIKIIDQANTTNGFQMPTQQILFNSSSNSVLKPKIQLFPQNGQITHSIDTVQTLDPSQIKGEEDGLIIVDELAVEQQQPNQSPNIEQQRDQKKDK